MDDLDEGALEELVAVEGKVPDEPADAGADEAGPVGGHERLHLQPIDAGGDAFLAQPLPLGLSPNMRNVEERKKWRASE